jgi:flagellin
LAFVPEFQVTSILTNAGAMTALQALAQTQTNLSIAQRQISTGLSVPDASQNAAYWSISTTMKSDNGALGAVHDSLNLGAATVGVADTALTNVISVMNQIKKDLVSAAEPGVDKTKVQTDITALQAQLSSIANSAAFNGVNWLSVNSAAGGYNPTASVVSSFSRDFSGAITISTITVDTTMTKLYDSNGQTGILDSVNASTGESIATMDIAALTNDTADRTVLTGLTSQVDAAIQSITSAASTLGATKTRIDIQSGFVSALSDSITNGVGALIDADMNEVSTRLQALQTQQQLGIQSLSIANQQTTFILKLFGI